MIKRFILLSFLTAGLAHAASISITNSSFEDPAGAPGDWTNTITGWTGNGAAGDAFIEYITGFSADGNQHLGVAQGNYLWQDTGVAWAANTQYQLTVAVGNRNDNFTVLGNLSTFGLYNLSPAGLGVDGSGSLAAGNWDAEVNVLDGSFLDAPTLTYTTGAMAPTGTIWVMVGADGPGRSHFDNIRLEATAIPEPSVGLLAGLAGLLFLRRRR